MMNPKCKIILQIVSVSFNKLFTITFSVLVSISNTSNFMIVAMVMSSFSEILSHPNQNNVLVANLKILSYLLK